MKSTKTMVTVRRDNDPFKKYWWVLLVGFGLTGLWVLIPLMGQTGSSRVAVPKASSGEEQGLQSLDSQANPSGAQGSALSMDGSLGAKKRSDEPVTSSLYEAPEGGAPGAPIVETAASASPNLASALKAVSKSDPTGWGGAAPQKGFTAPKGRFGALSGTGGSSSGGSGASMSASPFNTPTANVSISDGQTAGSGESALSGGKAYMRTVRSAEARSQLASKMSSGDGARSGAGSSFDGSGMGGKTIGSKSGDIVFGQFDHGMAPANLKKGPGGGAYMDPKASDALAKAAGAIGDMKGKEVKADYEDQMGKQMGQMVMMMVVGGVMNAVAGPTAGAMLTMFAMQSTQMLQQNSVKK